jgi:glycosyltransferase involved in cell wall biosynthesis
MKDRLRVVIATHKKRNEAFFKETVESIREQGIEPVIMSDDRKTAYKWDQAIEECDVEYLSLPHHDDIYRPGFFEAEVAYLDAHPECAAVFTLDKIIDEKGNVQRQTRLPFQEQDSYDFDFVLKNMMRHGNFLRCPSVMLRASMVKGMKYPDEGCGSAADTAMWFQILNKHPIGIINKPLYLYREHSASDTQKNVVGGGLAAYDHALALQYAANLRDTDWRIHAAISQKLKERDDALVAEKTEEDGRPLAFLLCHEPPYNAGTGILVAERVLRWDEGNSLSPRYVCPAGGSGKFVSQGVPVWTCHPNSFQDFIDEHRPRKIEYHHTLRWPLEILGVETDAVKELYLHDSHLWCEMWHSFNPKTEEVCNEPAPEKCHECQGITPEEFKRKNDYLRKVLPAFSRVIANSAYTKKYADMYLGTDCVVEEPVVPELPYVRERVKVGYFGGFYPVKGVNVLLNAWRKVMWGTLYLFCDVPEQFRDGRGIHGMDHVVCCGSYDRKHLPYLARLVDFAVVPSLNESFGLVKRELEMLGVPCLATDAGGLAGSIEAGNPGALAKAIQEEIDKHER